MQENMFDYILDKDEKILKVLKPNKSRAWFAVILSSVFVALFWLCFELSFLVDGGMDALIYAISALVFLVVYGSVLGVMITLWLNKTIYAVTNKRILIRTGYIGVDYKSLDFTMLGALVVNVNWIDKLLKKNTGSLSFGSMASPMTTRTMAKFNFSYIQNPYAEYKEIKSIIDEYKDK